MWLQPSTAHHLLLALIPQSSTGSAGGTIQASPGPGNTEHQTRSEYSETYGKVYSSNEDEAAQEARNNTNAANLAEHNAKGQTLQTTGGIEGAWQHANAKLSFSEQRLVDCSRMNLFFLIVHQFID